MTFYFYRINKTQIIKFTIEAIERRVIDPAVDTRITNNAFVSQGNISAIPNSVLATDTNRLQIEAIGRASAVARQQNTTAVGVATPAFGAAVGFTRVQPFYN